MPCRYLPASPDRRGGRHEKAASGTPPGRLPTSSSLPEGILQTVRRVKKFILNKRLTNPLPYCAPRSASI